MKYIKKDMPTFTNKKRYWSSQGLNKPQTIDNPKDWYSTSTPNSTLITEFGRYLFFNKKTENNSAFYFYK